MEDWKDGQIVIISQYSTLSLIATTAQLPSETLQHQSSMARDPLTLRCLWATGYYELNRKSSFGRGKKAVDQTN